MKKNATHASLAFRLHLSLLIILSITLLSTFKSNAQNIINLNSSSKTSFKNVEAASDLSEGKRSRDLILNEKIQSNREVKVKDTILLDLFSNKQYKATVEKVEIDVNGTLSIRAKIVGYDHAYCFITTFKGKSLITIDIPGNNEYYSSKYNPQTNTYRLLEVDNTKRDAVDGSEPLVPPTAVQSENKKNNENPVSNSPIALNGENDLETITVMVVYTPAAAAWAALNETNINNTISLMMEKSRLVHANSNTLVNLQLVHSQEVNYTELNNEDDLNYLTGTNDGFMDEVHTLRNTHDADLVVLLEVASFTGGIAWLLNNPAGSAAYGFSLIRVQQASWTYTVVHEIGHNMGCGHHKSQNAQPGPGIFAYSSGSRWTSSDGQKYCSIMSYESGSYYTDKTNHTRVPYFSSPNLSYLGTIIGTPTDADNAKTIKQTKTAIAKYRNGRTNQTITAPSWQNRTFGDADFDHNITSSSGLPVTIVSSNPTIATVVGNKIKILGAGSCIISINQTGNDTFNPVALNLTLTINKANQIITFPTFPTIAINAPDFDPGAISSSGLAITYTTSNPSVATIVGGKMHTVAQGTVTITASQSGNSNYNAAASVARLFNVAGLAQTINFPAIEPKEFNSPDFDGGAVASSGLPIVYTSSNTNVASIVNNKIHIVGAGKTTITATQAGDATYGGAIATVNLVVNKQKQTISFASLDVKNHNDADFDLTATSSSGLPISYSSSNTAVASIIGNRVHIIAAGTTVITASQTGNSNILAAPDVARNLDVFFNIPNSNFTIKSTDETCKTSDNGAINITAAQTLGYTATVTGNNKTTSYSFNSVLAINNLTAGSYNVCITVAGQANYKQCFDVVVKEPKDLAAYASLKNDESLVVLKLEGSDFYKIELNGQLTTTTQQEITLPLIKGSNVVKVSTDKICQGVIEKVFLTTGGISLYPNPVKDILNISTGKIDSGPTKIDIHAVDGRLVHSSQELAGNGRISVDLSRLSKGLYVLTLSSGNTKTVHKIIKD